MEIDQRTITRGKVAYVVRVSIDEGYSASEYTSRDESPELFAALDNGEVAYVTVTVTPEIDGVEITEASDSLGGIEFGTCPAWEPENIGMDYLCAVHPVPDMIDEAEANLAAIGAKIMAAVQSGEPIDVATLPDRKMTNCIECKGYGQAHDSACGNYQNPADWSTADRSAALR